MQKLQLELGKRFTITVEIDGKQLAAALTEIEIYRSIYTVEHLLDAIRIKGFVSIGIYGAYFLSKFNFSLILQV